MKLVLIFGVVSFVSAAVSHAALPDEKLIQALIQVESQGNDAAHGDLHLKNQAYGCLQIRKPVCDDVNRKCGTHYKPEDCLNNRELSVKICKIYIDMYARDSRLKHTPTHEDMARIWNGGPNGYRRPSTLSYWQQVKDALEG